MILVGPSGCGKSTALRMIAGLEDITDGDLIIGGERVNDLAPRDRDIAMVFQNYALYPHMTVRDNMGFALKLAKVDKDEIDQQGRARRREILDLEQHLERKPANLSGGQRQRVAMGRAIVRDPKAFLMDEPLSNLDAKLRVQMRTEVARIQQRLGTTTVYVTHDQTEAMTLGDRVAVMRAGVIQQVDTPKTLYDDPANLFVAGFIGSPAMNFLPAQARGRHDQAAVRRRAAARQELARSRRDGKARDVIAGIRPEHFEDADVGRDAARRAEVHGQGRRRRVDGLRALRLLRRRGARQHSPTELDELAEDAGLERPARARRRRRHARSSRASTPAALRRPARRSSSCSTRRGSSCSTPTAAAT